MLEVFFKKKQRGGLAFLKRNSILDNKFCVEGSVSFLPLKLRFFFSHKKEQRSAGSHFQEEIQIWTVFEFGVSS